MFSGVVEGVAQVRRLTHEGNNLRIILAYSFATELRIDQSIAHNEVCLTVVLLEEGDYTMITVRETLDRSNLEFLQVGNYANVERSVMLRGRPDGHIVQEYVNQTACCTAIRKMDRNHYFTFAYEVDREMMRQGCMTVEKGSVAVNGVSLTVCSSQENSFEVVIIPYAPEHTNFKYFKEGSVVNLEFGILGRYIVHLRPFD